MSKGNDIPIYVLVLPSSVIGFAAAWSLIAPGHLYNCWDDCPPLAISWLPPFIHGWGDHFIAAEWVVYSTWFLFIVGAFLMPAVLGWLLARFKAHSGRA